MLWYYWDILGGCAKESIVIDYSVDVVDGSSNFIRVVDKSVAGKKDELSYEEFEQRIKNLNGLFLLYYEKGVLLVKRFKGDILETRRYHLTKKVHSNRNFMKVLRNLEQNSKFEFNIVCEKFCSPLARLVYEDKDLIINTDNDLVEFKNFVGRRNVIDCLSCHLRDKILKEMHDKNFLSFLNPFLNYKVYRSAKKSVEKKIAVTIRENEKRLRFGHKQNEAVNFSSDSFIDDIRKNIVRINESKYEGYREHLKILCRLAEYYLKAKKLNSDKTPYELFVQNDSLMTALITIEKTVDEAIKEHDRTKTSDDILAELIMMSGLSSAELVEQNSEKLGEGLGSASVQQGFGVAYQDDSLAMVTSEVAQLKVKK